MKFEFTGETAVFFGITFGRIRATLSFGNITKGDVGGWLEKKENLSQNGNAWVYGNARVYGDAQVYGNAQVYGDAQVYGNAQVSDNAQVYGDAWVSGNAWVYGNAASDEEIARLDQVRKIVLAKPTRLCMGAWHSGNWDASHTPEEEHKCGSAHCIAGWLQALSPDENVRKMEPADAGRLLAPASQLMFHVSDAVALRWLKDRGYAQHKAQP